MKKHGFIYYDGPFVRLDINFEKEFGKKNFMEFYSVFMPNYEFSVKQGKYEVGTIDSSFVMLLSKNDEFYLGGKKWKINTINKDKFTVQVSQSKLSKANIPKWNSEGSPLSYLIARKTYDILLGEYTNDDVKTFDEKSLETLNFANRSAANAGFIKNHIPIEIENKDKYNKVFIYTFGGNKVNALLSTIFKLYFPKLTSLKVSSFSVSFNIDKNTKIYDIINILENIENILSQKDIDVKLSSIIGDFNKNKFIRYLAIEDQIEIKNEVLFDKNNLINLCRKNKICIANEFDLKNWL